MVGVTLWRQNKLWSLLLVNKRIHIGWLPKPGGLQLQLMVVIYTQESYILNDLVHPGCISLNCDMIDANEAESITGMCVRHCKLWHLAVSHLFVADLGKPFSDGKPIQKFGYIFSNWPPNKLRPCLSLNIAWHRDSWIESGVVSYRTSRHELLWQDFFVSQVRIYGLNRPVIKLGVKAYANLSLE